MKIVMHLNNYQVCAWDLVETILKLTKFYFQRKRKHKSRFDQVKSHF